MLRFMEEELIRIRYLALRPFLDERQRRLYAAAEANAMGHGGVSAVSRATGVSRRAIQAGKKELDSRPAPPQPPYPRTRRKGGGRKPATDKDPTLRECLEGLMEPSGEGGRDSPLRWTCKSVRRLADELRQAGHAASHNLVAELLRSMGYNLWANRRSAVSNRHVLFEDLCETIEAHRRQRQPVLVLEIRTTAPGPETPRDVGRRRRSRSDAQRNLNAVVLELQHVSSAEAYRLAGEPDQWTGAGIDGDNAAFVVETIRCWWDSMGRKRHPHAHRLLVAVDGPVEGGRLAIWEHALQKLANEVELAITVYRLPPGTHKWQKIEHRQFAVVTRNWRRRPLVSQAVTVSLISGKAVRKGTGAAKGRRPESRDETTECDTHAEPWSYTIVPE